MGTLGVHIGLNSVNVTLKAMPIYNQSSDIDYNERFHWVGATQMKEDYIAALQKGLPFPILTVGEYFTVDAEGFCWGRNYREAGCYTSIFLWMAFALWVLSNLLLIVVPRYGANLMTLTGFTLLALLQLHLLLPPPLQTFGCVREKMKPSSVGSKSEAKFEKVWSNVSNVRPMLAKSVIKMGL